MLSHDLPILVVRAVISSSCWWCELCLRRSSSNSISCCHMTYQYSWWGRWFPLAAGDASSAWAVHPVTQSHAVTWLTNTRGEGGASCWWCELCLRRSSSNSISCCHMTYRGDTSCGCEAWAVHPVTQSHADDLPILVVRAVISSSCWWCELCLRRSSSNSISCCHMTYRYSWWGRWFPLAAGDASSAWGVHPVTQSHADLPILVVTVISSSCWWCELCLRRSSSNSISCCHMTYQYSWWCLRRSSSNSSCCHMLVVRAVSSCWWCELCLRRSSSNSISCCHMTYQYSWWGRWFPLAAGDVSSAWGVHPVTQSHAVTWLTNTRGEGGDFL